MIAKFPFHLDEYDMQKWEAVALILAKQSGINISLFKIMSAGNQSVLLLSRFDRKNNHRIPFVSALTMLGSKDNEQSICGIIIRESNFFLLSINMKYPKTFIPNAINHILLNGCLWPFFCYISHIFF